MNFVPAQITEDGVSSVLGDLPLTDRVRDHLADSDAPTEVVLGVRPEHFEDASLVGDAGRAGGAVFTGTADVVESMGSDKYVYFALEGTARARTAELDELAADAGATDIPGGFQLVTRLAAESPAAENATVRVWFPAAKVHLFDPATGRNLTLDTGPP